MARKQNVNLEEEELNENSGSSNTVPSKYKGSSRLSKENKRVNKRGNFIEIMTEDALNKVTKGNLDIQQSPFEITYNKIMSANHCKEVYQIVELPVDGVVVGFLDAIRDEILFSLSEEERKYADLIFPQHIRGNPQNMSNRKIKYTENTLKKQQKSIISEIYQMENPISTFSKEMVKEAENDPRLRSSIEMKRASRDEIHNSKQRLIKVEKKIKSFEVIDNFQRNGGKTVDLFLFIEVVAVNTAILTKVSKKLLEILDKSGYISIPILELKNYQTEFGIASLKDKVGKIKSNFIPFLTTSNIPACSYNFQAGIIRSDYCELYMGNNVENNYRFDLSFTDSGTAENYLMLARTSAGKSGFISMALLTAMDNSHINIIIKDYKGKEWSKFASIFPEHAHVLSLGGNDNGCFLNTYKIPDYRIYGFKDPTSAFVLSSGITIKILTCLVDTTKEKRKIVQDICTDIVNKVYMNKSVIIDSVSSYRNSNNIIFKEDTWLAVLDMVQDKDMIKRYNSEDIQLVKRALEPYFTVRGIKSKYFENEVNLEAILLNNRIMVIDYNADGAGGGLSQTDNEIKTRILMETFAENLFCELQKRNGKYTIVITEDLNCQLDDDLILEELAKSFSSGKFKNKINIGISSVADPFFKSSNKYIRTIMENLTGYIIGNCESAVANSIVEYTKMDNLRESLRLVSSGNGKYKYAFMFYSITGKVNTVITKMPVTEGMLRAILPSKTKIVSNDNYKF